MNYNFGNFKKIPDLLDLQKKKFFEFVNSNNLNSESDLKSLFKLFFPIIKNKKIIISFIDYHFLKFQYKISVTKLLDQTFTYSLYATFNIKYIFIKNKTKIELNNLFTIYLGEIPFMLENGSFLINGDEKVLINQIYRSSGIYLLNTKSDCLNSNFLIKLVPIKGSWLEFEINSKNYIYLRIDKGKKFLASTLFTALGCIKSEIITFYENRTTIFVDLYNQCFIKFNKILFINEKFKFNFYYKNKIFIYKNTVIDLNMIKAIEYLEIDFFNIKINELINYRLGNSITLDIYTYKKYDLIDNYFIKNLFRNQNFSFTIILDDIHDMSTYLSTTFDNDKCNQPSIASEYLINTIFKKKKKKPNQVKDYIHEMFFNRQYYDLSKIGRFKLNQIIKNNNSSLVLNLYDFLLIIKNLIYLKLNKINLSDIDNLSNRRIKSIDNFIFYQLKTLFKKTISFINYKSNLENCFNSKIITNTIYDYFNINSLCQFMDQVNVLSEISHKRRLTSLGSGGLTKQNASFEIRDVNFSHYGKICPIETPEGPNIGLINYFSLYSYTDKYGFIITPYILILNGKITNIIHYINAIDEENLYIAQFNNKIDCKGNLIENILLCRNKNNFEFCNKKNINYMDVSAQQTISVSASLIPFLEHNDANRALMGCNMQKQAVPILFAKKPLVSTGTEIITIESSCNNIYSKTDGIVKYADANSIIIQSNNNKQQYNLLKYDRTNQNTLIHQRCVVDYNQSIKKNDLIAESVCSNENHLSIGNNVRVAFMSYEGYNYEDSILISEKLIQNDLFTSLHMYEYTCTIRNTKFGPEETSNDVFCYEPDLLKHLDMTGVIKIGTYVKEGDILVGKLTPIEDITTTAEQKLIFAVFNRKIKKVKNSSLKVKKGQIGEVIDVHIITKNELNQSKKYIKLIDLLKKKKILNKELEIILNLPFSEIKSRYPYFKSFETEFTILKNEFSYFNKKNNKLLFFNELPLDIIKIIKIKIAVKKILQVGDKMSGRYGNKGVISKICNIEDMPFDQNGNPIEVILNPLGVPSRMNLGQLFEIDLSQNIIDIKKNILKLIQHRDIDYLFNYLNTLKINNNIQFSFDKNQILNIPILNIESFLNNNIKFYVPAFNNFTKYDIDFLKNNSNFEEIVLFDGKTGQKFVNKIKVGIMYLMKLNHLSEDKIHARSTGTYSLITQQPLGGKSQFGGQRFGEMEVWALEAYGAAFTLNEMLTVKSDDLIGRTELYQSLIQGKNFIESSSTESFNILINEIRSLGFNIELNTHKEEEKDVS